MKLLKSNVPFYILLILIGLGVRLGIDFLLWRNGYFYGKEYDTFVRAALSWHWAYGYYIALDYYWLPLQFWIVGIAYKLIIPITKTVELWVPVTVNHLFLAGSLAITSFVANHMGGKRTAIIATILSVTTAGDIWATFSALSEPFTIFFSLGTSLTALLWVQAWGQSDRQKKQAILLGVWVGLAAITHFMGWFFSIMMIIWAALYGAFLFFTMRKTGNIFSLKKYFNEISAYLIAVIIAWLPIFYWLFVNWQHYGDPVHFLSVASSAQLYYAKTKPFLYRAFSPLAVLWQYAPILVSLAVISVPFVVKKYGKIWIAYILPISFHFFILAITGALALSASYQEPRYLVMYIWVLLPFTAALCSYLIDSYTRSSRTVGYGLLIFIVVTSLWQAFHYTNSFSADVKNMSDFSRQWFNSHSDSQLVIEDVGAAEEIIIPMTSGYPNGFFHAEKQEFISICEGDNTNSKIPRNALWILSADTFQVIEKEAGLIEKIGSYRLVRPCE